MTTYYSNKHNGTTSALRFPQNPQPRPVTALHSTFWWKAPVEDQLPRPYLGVPRLGLKGFIGFSSGGSEIEGARGLQFRTLGLVWS